MSTLAVGTIKSISSAAPLFQNTSGTVMGTLVRIWVNFQNGDSINDSVGVSSVTDNGTGDFTVNFSSSFSDNDYAWSCSGGRGSNQGAIIAVQGTTNMASDSFRFQTINVSNNKEDFTHTCFLCTR
jgi:hypothetical protein